MVRHAVYAWFLMIPAAIANGIVRETVVTPIVGDQTARQISVVTASALFLSIAYYLLRDHAGEEDDRTLLGIGASWLLATILFEFGFGHYVDGKSWSELTHERAGALPDFHEAGGFQIAVGLNNRGGIDAELGRELAYGRERGRRPQLTRGDGDAEARGDLRVQRRGTSWVDPFEHLGPLLYWCTNTVRLLSRPVKSDRLGRCDRGS